MDLAGPSQPQELWRELTLLPRINSSRSLNNSSLIAPEIMEIKVAMEVFMTMLLTMHTGTQLKEKGTTHTLPMTDIAENRRALEKLTLKITKISNPAIQVK